MNYGVSFYPEQKNSDELAHDIQCIVKSGINTVRMGEFAWCRFEPREGVYDFAWLDTVVEELGSSGIRSIICTPTACPPAWLVEKHPEILYVDNRHVRRPFGGRRHYCYNNEVYRHYSALIAEKIGEHYGRHPFVLGFQIDNEPAQEYTGRCHCEVCTQKFRKYLEKKYGTIEEFNQRSGSIFWSQEYTSFRQINPPVNTIEVHGAQSIPAFHENPTIRLEFERFSSDSQIEYQNIQAQCLKRHTRKMVTTNTTGLATNSIDYYRSTKNLDCYTFDYYPRLRDAHADAFPYAFARGVQNTGRFGVMEFMSGGGHRLGGSGRQQPNPGALKQAVFQAHAHGADLMLHFQYRSFPFGAEQLNYAIVDLDGVPRRRYYEMQETARLMKELEPYESSSFENQAVILMDYDTHWALRIKPANDEEFDYLDSCGAWYHRLQKLGIGADVCGYESDWSKYRLVILPSAFVLSDDMRARLKQYVQNGGILVSGFLTGVKNTDNVGETRTLPAGLTDLFGVTVEEVEPVFSDNRADVGLTLDGQNRSGLDNGWSELIKETTARILGRYTSSYKAGWGVVSENSYGSGKAYYLGTMLEEDSAAALLDQICAQAALPRIPFEIPEGIEVVCRLHEGKNLYYMMNFTGGTACVKLDKEYLDVLAGQEKTAVLDMPQQGFALLREL